jgi:hypothetical protein
VQRRFADDAERDAVILSAQDIRVAQEAITLAREDRAAGREPANSESADPDQPRSTPDQPDSKPDLPRRRPDLPRRTPDQPPHTPDQPRSVPDQPHPARDLARAAPDQATRPPGRTPAQPSTAASGTPSWGTVLATTIRLWWQRHVASPRWRVVTVLVLAGVLLAAAALGVALSRGSGHSTASSAGQGAGGQTAGTAAIKTAAAARTAAARWLVQQAAVDAIVSCDPQMCAVAQSAGLAASRLQVLSTGASGPLSSDLLVATAAVRQEFGTRLASVYAPDVLASFGTGSAQVAIRVVAPDGAAAYATSLHADQAARVAAGKQLLRNPRIHAGVGSLRALAHGRVDARLLTVFAALATLHSVQVLGFPPAPAGASPGLPLRIAYLAAAGPGTRQRPNSVQSMASFLRAQLPPYRPASVTVFQRPGGGQALRVEFAAPSPLGLLGKS